MRGPAKASFLRHRYLIAVGAAVVLVIAGICAWLYLRHLPPKIQFFGEVVDASGKPLSGCDVEVGIWRQRYDARRHRLVCDDLAARIHVMTASDGRFAITNARGAVLQIRRIVKPGYEWVRDLMWTDPANPSAADNRYFSFVRIGEAPVYHPDPDRPAIFPLVPEGSHDVVTTSRGGTDEFPDGRWVDEGPSRPVFPTAGAGSMPPSYARDQLLKKMILEARQRDKSPKQPSSRPAK